MYFKKISKVFSWDVPNAWWYSHTMAPSAIYWINRIRVFIGAWDKSGISRITYVDLDPYEPTKIIGIKSDSPILDIGEDGMFDENGVFPAHAVVLDGKIYLYYTGFQKGYKIPYYNFGGLAISEDGEFYKRVSKAPILDRSDEGLYVRAGESVLKDGNIYRVVYSAGSSFLEVGGKKRPCYDIYYQETLSPYLIGKTGKKIISANYNIEHGLGRPQIIKIREEYYVFFTRRILNMKYFLGAAKSKDCVIWEKDEKIFSNMKHSENGFDSEMIYFPSVVYVPPINKYLLFYCGNDFGKTGFGYAELEEN